MFLFRIFIGPCDLDLRPFDLDDVWWIKLRMSSAHTNFSILLSVPELYVTQSDHITFTWNGHCACAVSRDLSPGAKMIHIFEIPEPNLPIHFVTFTVLRYGRKIAFSHCEGYKVYCACAVSRDLCPGEGPLEPHVTIFWPRIAYSLYNFYGATTTINGSFILENPHVKAIFGCKKNKSSQNRSPKWRFFGNLRV